MEEFKTDDITLMDKYSDNTVGIINAGPDETVFVKTSHLIGRLKDKEDVYSAWVSIDVRDEMDSGAVLSQANDGYIQIVHIPGVV